MDMLHAEPAWSYHIDDQGALIEVLKETDGCEAVFLLDGEIFNWDRRFIKQIIREKGSVEYRTRRLDDLVNHVLEEANEQKHSLDVEGFVRDFVYGLYHAILLRDPDPVGQETVERMLLTGERNCLQEMRACFGSQEFAGKAVDFLCRYLEPASIENLAVELGRRGFGRG